MHGGREKRAIIAIFVIIMAFTFAIPAFTAGPPPATGDLYIHKYIGAETNEDNNGIELDTSDWAAIPVNNIVFDLYRVGAAVAHTPEWPEIPPVGTCSIADGNLVVTNDGVTEGIYALAAAGSIVTGSSGTTPEDGVAIAEGLARGLYLVVENATESRTHGVVDPEGTPMAIIAGIAPFLVPVPMTTVEGTGWLEEVHVYPKNEEMSITKSVDIEGDAIMVGDKVTYTIISSLPGDIASGQSAEITDVLDQALTLDLDTIVVTTVTAATLNRVADGVGDYTVTYEGRTLKISFTENGRKKLDGLASVTVKFDCTINSGILSYVDFTISNTAEMEFINDSNVAFVSMTREQVDVHTAAIKVIKVDESGVALTGAVFKIATSSANAAAGRFIRKNPSTGDLVDYSPLTESDWLTLGTENDYKGTTVANITTFSGLKDIEDDSCCTYYIVETAAPAGYNLLSSAKEVTFTGDEDDYTLEATVVNYSGFILPRTGGIGTIIWTVSGIMLIGVAVIILATKRKRTETRG